MTKTLFLESVAGIAGDMFAASFVDAGLVSIAELQALPSLLNLAGVEIEESNTIKATMKATHIVVKWKDEAWKHSFGEGHSHNHTHKHDHSHEHTHEDQHAHEQSHEHDRQSHHHQDHHDD